MKIALDMQRIFYIKRRIKYSFIRLLILFKETLDNQGFCNLEIKEIIDQ
jgi:hypothetical protein